MSQAYVKLTALHMPGYSLRALQTPSMSGPFSPGRGIVLHSPSLCTVRFSFFSGIRSALYLMPRPRTRPPSLSFLPSFGSTTTRTPPSSSAPSYLLSFISHPLTPGAHHDRVYPHSMTHLCTPSMPSPLLVCCAPPLFAAIRYPWSLLFFFFFPFPCIRSRATRSSRPLWN